MVQMGQSLRKAHHFTLKIPPRVHAVCVLGSTMVGLTARGVCTTNALDVAERTARAKTSNANITTPTEATGGTRAVLPWANI